MSPEFNPVTANEVTPEATVAVNVEIYEKLLSREAKQQAYRRARNQREDVKAKRRVYMKERYEAQKALLSQARAIIANAIIANAKQVA